jgi:DNA-directed RNA polymerase subunit beta'
VCHAFNADFDGDQMAVHLPLSAEAQAEARILMLSSNNILSPAHGKPLATPTQDMVLGTYYLTYSPEDLTQVTVADARKRKLPYFGALDEVELAYDQKQVKLQDPITVRESGDWIVTTAGRAIFNDEVSRALQKAVGEKKWKPSDYTYQNRTFTKREMTDFISELVDRCGATAIAEVLDTIKELGFSYATRSGVTISKNDIQIPPDKEQILTGYEEQVGSAQRSYDRGLITEDERHEQVVSLWNKATDDVGEAMNRNLDELNPVYMMANSGARGSFKQIRQLAGMRGLMANPKGEIIERPIKSNFMEGLSVLEYFISTHGARKGLADTALRTADSGYLTRRLVDVSQDVIIRRLDCGSKGSIMVPARTSDGLANRSGLIGRVIAADTKIGKLALKKGHEITGARLKEIAQAAGDDKTQAVPVRTVLKCAAEIGVCRACYGWSMATGKMGEIGDAVGTIAAQSIGEPGTQLTMRTFHTGGVAGLDITHGLPRVVELFEARKPKAAATLVELAGRVAIDEGERGYTVTITPTGDGDADSKEYAFPRRTRLRVSEGEVIEVGAPLNEGPLAPVEVLDLRDDTETARYLVAEVQEVYKSQGVEIHDKHIELIVRQMLKKVRIDNSGDTEYLPGELVDRPVLERTLRQLRAEKKEPPTHTQLILGITKASLATQSFLSAASFQETTKVLTDAALEGKTDHLVGLKENVIIGKLIPASTGLREYRSVTIEPAEDAPRFYVEDFAEPPVYTDALIGGDGHTGPNGDIDLTPKPGAEAPFIPPVPEEE